MIAYHGNPAIKLEYTARVAAHRAADDIIRGTYGEAVGEGGWRGCAVGCTIHVAYESELGIPQVLARLENRLFEMMPEAAAMAWPGEFLSAIPVGADLSLVVWQLLEWGIRDLLRFATDATRHAMERVLSEVLVPLSRGEMVSAYAAYAAADAARENAAYQWSRELLRLMAAAPVPERSEATP